MLLNLKQEINEMITDLVILAFVVGLLTVPVIIGMIEWFRHFKLRMTWWKWLLSAIWYLMLLFLVLAAFTFIGEGEPVAGWKLLGSSAVIIVILGAGLVRILLAGRENSQEE